MIKKISDIKADLEIIRDSHIQRGSNTGFKSLDALYSVKQGTYTCILAAPGHGKTEMALELAFNQAEKYGKRCLVNSPETGSSADVVAELIHKYTGKSIYKSNPVHCDEKQYYSALAWIEHNFVIMDNDLKAYSFAELFETCDQWEKENKQKIDLIIGDPYNEHRHDMKDFGSRQDLYIEETMSFIRRYVKNSNKHFILCLHPAFQPLVNEGGKRYHAMPMAREAAGGQALLRKAFCWINIWRPPTGLNNEHGQPYLENEVLVQMEKAKPKGVAEKGMISLFFDWKRNRYYENIAGQSYYAFEHEKLTFDNIPFPKMPQSKMFNEVEKEDIF